MQPLRTPLAGVRTYAAVSCACPIACPPAPRNTWQQLPSILRSLLARGLEALDDYEFEQFVAEAFKQRGYAVKTTRRGADDRVDVFMSR